MFRSANLDHVAKFNSANASDLVELYEHAVDSSIKKDASRKSHQTFAASSLRCMRRSWFRLRGVQPDELKVSDPALEFSARIGTACHEMIQGYLANELGPDWLDVEDYIKSINLYDSSNYVIHKSMYETQVELFDPPIRFSCDGLINWKGIPSLIEIKSCDFASFQDLVNPKDEHVDQFKAYCTLLGLDVGYFIYIDRQYGSVKCYEQKVTQIDKDNLLLMFKHVQEYAQYGLVPEGLPKGDKWCTPNMCQYYKKCQEYGK